MVELYVMGCRNQVKAHDHVTNLTACHNITNVESKRARYDVPSHEKNDSRNTGGYRLRLCISMIVANALIQQDRILTAGLECEMASDLADFNWTREVRPKRGNALTP